MPGRKWLISCNRWVHKEVFFVLALAEYDRKSLVWGQHQE